MPQEWVYSYNSYHEEKLEEVQINKMLKYWEKNIIPSVMEYVRGSFCEYEVRYYLFLFSIV